MPDEVSRGTFSEPSQKADYSTWLTKQQAAEAIGVSTKTVEQLAKDRKLEQAVWRRPTGGPPLAVYHPDDVDRIARERHPEPPAFVLPAVPTTNGNGHGVIARAVPRSTGPDLSGALVAMLAEFAAALQTVTASAAATSQNSQKSDTLFLTVDEAAAYLNWTPRDLRKAIRSGEVSCRHRQQRNWRTWRIRRKDLEAL